MIENRHTTFVDEMFRATGFYLGVGARVVTKLPDKAHENLGSYMQMEKRHLVEMLGLRARKFRSPRRRSYNI